MGGQSPEGSARYYAGATFSGSNAKYHAMLAQLLKTR
jgi:hypothetical protein